MFGSHKVINLTTIPDIGNFCQGHLQLGLLGAGVVLENLQDDGIPARQEVIYIDSASQCTYNFRTVPATDFAPPFVGGCTLGGV